MKKTIITVWPELDAEDPTRDWYRNLSDEPIGRELLVREGTKYGRLRETWMVTITDHDALTMKIKFPAIEFIE